MSYPCYRIDELGLESIDLSQMCWRSTLIQLQPEHQRGGAEAHEDYKDTVHDDPVLRGLNMRERF